jgi:hypothetical protein
MSEAGVAVDVDPGVIGTTVRRDVPHRRDDLRLARPRRIAIEKASYSTHDVA